MTENEAGRFGLPKSPQRYSRFPDYRRYFPNCDIANASRPMIGNFDESPISAPPPLGSTEQGDQFDYTFGGQGKDSTPIYFAKPNDDFERFFSKLNSQPSPIHLTLHKGERHEPLVSSSQEIQIIAAKKLSKPNRDLIAIHGYASTHRCKALAAHVLAKALRLCFCVVDWSSAGIASRCGTLCKQASMRH